MMATSRINNIVASNSFTFGGGRRMAACAFKSPLKCGTRRFLYVGASASDSLPLLHPRGPGPQRDRVKQLEYRNRRTFALSSAPITEVRSIPPAVLEKIRRPPPLDPPQLVVDGGSVKTVTLNVDGRDRTVHFYVPNSDFLARREARRIPLLIALHGATEHGLLFRASSTSYAYDELACREGFIVAYPDGYEGHWNDARVGSTFLAVTQNIDDVGFVKSIIDHASANLGTDAEKTMVTGWSNGGQFALRLLYEPAGPKISGLAVHCVSLPVKENNTFSTAPSVKARVPVILVNGTADPVNPYEGGEVAMIRLPGGKNIGGRGLHMGAKETAQVLANNWGNKTEAKMIDTSTSFLTHEDWMYNGHPVVRLVTMIGEGHHVSVPGGSDLPLFLGPALKKVHSSQEVIGFFKVATSALS